MNFVCLNLFKLIKNYYKFDNLGIQLLLIVLLMILI